MQHARARTHMKIMSARNCSFIEHKVVALSHVYALVLWACSNPFRVMSR